MENNPFEHIFYEFDMYLNTINTLEMNSLHRDDGNNKFCINLLLESQMLHLRNISEFFASSNKASKKRKDLYVSDYLINSHGFFIDDKLFKNIKRYTSSSACHLSRDRKRLDQKEKTCEMEQKALPVIMSLIEKFINVTVDQIKPDYKELWEDSFIQDYLQYIKKLLKSC